MTASGQIWAQTAQPVHLSISVTVAGLAVRVTGILHENDLARTYRGAQLTALAAFLVEDHSARHGSPSHWPPGRLARFILRRVVGFEPPEDGAPIRDGIAVDRSLAAAGGPYAYYVRERSKKLVVKIPAGVRDGQQIRLAGMGHPGRAGGRPGDLFLHVRLRSSWREKIMQTLSRWLKR